MQLESKSTTVMLRLLEPIQYRVEYRSIIVVVGGGGAVINVVNHAAAGVAAQHLFDKHAITCVTDTRRLRCSDCRIFAPPRTSAHTSHHRGQLPAPGYNPNP